MCAKSVRSSSSLSVLDHLQRIAAAEELRSRMDARRSEARGQLELLLFVEALVLKEEDAVSDQERVHGLDRRLIYLTEHDAADLGADCVGDWSSLDRCHTRTPSSGIVNRGHGGRKRRAECGISHSGGDWARGLWALPGRTDFR